MILLVRVNCIDVVQALVHAIITIGASDTRQWSHSDVLRKELFRREVVHEVLGRDVAAVLFVLLYLQLLELTANGLRHLFEHERERLLTVVRTNVLIELRVYLLDDLGAPRLHLVVDQLNLLAQLVRLHLILRQRMNRLVERFNFRRERRAAFTLLLMMRRLAVVMLHLKFMQLARETLVLLA